MPLAELVAESVPHPAEHTVPPWLSPQVTPPFVGSFRTVAANCCVAFTGMSADGGETETVIDSGTMVSVAKADLDGSDTEVAVSARVGFVGTVAGAV